MLWSMLSSSVSGLINMKARCFDSLSGFLWPLLNAPANGCQSHHRTSTLLIKAQSQNIQSQCQSSQNLNINVSKHPITASQSQPTQCKKVTILTVLQSLQSPLQSTQCQNNTSLHHNYHRITANTVQNHKNRHCVTIITGPKNQRVKTSHHCITMITL